MARSDRPDTDQLLSRVGAGDRSAVGPLLDRHRGRLRGMIVVRMDDRLCRRVDPSDVVQETFAAAAQRLDEYIRDRSLPFYPWLRQIAWDRLIELHRRHVRAAKRSVKIERSLDISSSSAMQLADRLQASGASPPETLIRKELKARVTAALARLQPSDREILILRHLEELTIAETAAVLTISTAAAAKRYLRALERLRTLMGADGE